jgi:hypothetical protein
MPGIDLKRSVSGPDLVRQSSFAPAKLVVESDTWRAERDRIAKLSRTAPALCRTDARPMTNSSRAPPSALDTIPRMAQLNHSDIQAASRFVRYGIPPEKPLPFDLVAEQHGDDRLVFTQVSLAARAWFLVRLPDSSHDAAERFTLSWKHVPRTLALMGQAGLKVALRLKSGTAKLRSGD